MIVAKVLTVVLFGLLAFSPAEPKRRSRRTPLNITGVKGVEVDLKCKVKLQECGNFYSIEWYKEKLSSLDLIDPEGGQGPGDLRDQQHLAEDADLTWAPDEEVLLGRPASSGQVPTTSLSASERVYVYRHHSGLAKAENSWEGRARHSYDAKRHLIKIRLAPIDLQDEAAYRCEITYEEAGRWFKDSCLAPQVTQLNVVGRPTFVTVSLENDTEIISSTEKNPESVAVIGPYRESHLLILRCKAGGGRPIPEVKTIDSDKNAY